MTPRILVVNQNWMGDVLCSTPALRALRKRFPDSFIACLLPARCEDLLRRNPHINETIAYGRTPLLFLRRRRFDRAIFFHRSRTKVLWALWAGIPERIGYSTPRRQRFLTHAVTPPVGRLHKVDYFLNLLEQSGIPRDGRAVEFIPDPKASALWEGLLLEHGHSPHSPYAVVHACGNWPLKRWKEEFFIEWIRLFRERFSWRIFLCGTQGEEGILQRFGSAFTGDEVVSLCGKTSVDVLAVLLKNAKFLLSNDSGPIHLAASQKTPILGIFGPTHPEETGPVSEGPVVILHKDVGCEVPCYFRSCNYRVCMDWITPEEVFEKTLELLRTLD